MEKKKKGFLAEFKEFALRGNMLDLAVGVIIGAAVSAVTSSIVNDLIMPIIGLIIGGVDFSGFSIKLGPIYPGAEATYLNVGMFIMKVIDFLLIALVVFFMVKGINRLRRKKKEEPAAPPAPPAPSAEEVLLTEIRDLLKAGK